MGRRSGDDERALTGESIYQRRGWRISPVLRSMTFFTWIPLFIIAILLMGTSLIGPIYLMKWSLSIYNGATASAFLDICILAFSLAASYILFGISMLFFGGLLKRLLDPFFGLDEGEHPFISTTSGYWSIVNGIILINRQFFLELTRTTFLSILFYRWMGMRIGRRTLINSSYLYDPDLVSIGRDVTIGGDVMILGHVGEKGILRLKRTRIGDRVDIGQSTLVMPGVKIGEGSMVGAYSLVTKNTTIPPYEVWGGVPARRISKLEPIYSKKP